MDALREYMRERDLTQGALAKLLDVSQPTVCDYLSGKIRPSADMLLEISQCTGLSVDELLKPRRIEKRRRAS